MFDKKRLPTGNLSKSCKNLYPKKVSNSRDLKLFLQISKIVTKSTQEGTGNKAPALFFYSAGVGISRFSFIFVVTIWQIQLRKSVYLIELWRKITLTIS